METDTCETEQTVSFKTGWCVWRWGGIHKLAICWRSFLQESRQGSQFHKIHNDIGAMPVATSARTPSLVQPTSGLHRFGFCRTFEGHHGWGDRPHCAFDLSKSCRGFRFKLVIYVFRMYRAVDSAGKKVRKKGFERYSSFLRTSGGCFWLDLQNLSSSPLSDHEWSPGLWGSNNADIWAILRNFPPQNSASSLGWCHIMTPAHCFVKRLSLQDFPVKISLMIS